MFKINETNLDLLLKNAVIYKCVRHKRFVL